MYDENLSPLLEACSDEELGPLVAFLLEPKTSLLAKDPGYVASPDRPSRYVGAIVREMRLFGGHSVKDRLGSGPAGRPWRTIVKDALAALGHKQTHGMGIAQLERQVVRRTLDMHFEELPEAKQQWLLAAFYRGDFFGEGIVRRTPLDDFQSLERPGEATMEREKVKRVLKQKAWGALGRQVKDKALKLGLRLAIRGAAAPVGVAMTLWDWLGPAYRVTIPAIRYVAYLRQLRWQN